MCGDSCTGVLSLSIRMMKTPAQFAGRFYCLKRDRSMKTKRVVAGPAGDDTEKKETQNAAVGSAVCGTCGDACLATAHCDLGETILRWLGVTAQVGLENEAQIEAHRQRFGENVLARARPVPLWRRVLEAFAEPMTLLLVMAVVILAAGGAFIPNLKRSKK